MTVPQSARGAPPLEHIAREVLSEVAGRQGQYAPVPVAAAPLTDAEKAEAAKVEQAKNYCRFCAGVHAMPSTAACPRIASAELDGDGQVKSVTFWPGRKWAQGRVVFIEDLEERQDDGE